MVLVMLELVLVVLERRRIENGQDLGMLKDVGWEVIMVIVVMILVGGRWE